MELPAIGKQCQEPTCRQLDFLPYTCKYCLQIYCQDHYKLRLQDFNFGHECPKYKELDSKAIVCPVCSQVVPVERGKDPNQAVEIHIQRNCPKELGSTTGKAFSNSCSFLNCTKKELIPIKCPKCQLQFCIKHRLEPDHQCTVKPNTTSKKPLTSSAKAALARLNASQSSTGDKNNNCKIS